MCLCVLIPHLNYYNEVFMKRFLMLLVLMMLPLTSMASVGNTIGDEEILPFRLFTLPTDNPINRVIVTVRGATGDSPCVSIYRELENVVKTACDPSIQGEARTPDGSKVDIIGFVETISDREMIVYILYIPGRVCALVDYPATRERSVACHEGVK